MTSATTMELDEREVGPEETVLRVARVPRGDRASGAARWAAITLAEEEGRGRYALYLLDTEGIPLEVRFAGTLEGALAQARELAGELRWGECSVHTYARLRIDPDLVTRFAPA